MKTAVKKAAHGVRNRITICLPSDLDQDLRREAGNSPNGELTRVILRYIEIGMAPDREVSTSSELLPSILMLGAALDLVREAGGGESEPLATARQLYGLLLEKAIYIDGVSE